MDEDLIVKMFKNGTSIREISKQTLIHRSKISGFLKKTNIDVSFGVDRQEIFNAFANGMPIKKIASHYKLKEGYVIKILNKFGVLLYKKRILTEQETLQAFLMYENGDTIQNIAEKLNCNKKHIQDCLRPMVNGRLSSLSHQNTRKLPISDNEIANLYDQEKTMEEIAKICATSTQMIKRILVSQNRNLRFKNKKYSVDDDYLNVIDSHEKAYFLGFFYGDGHHNAKKQEMIISIQSKDREVLDFFVKEIKSTRPIRLIKPRKIGWQEKAVFSFCSKKISDKLLNCGVGPNKTYILNFPDYIPNEFLSSFVLGIFDADGSIYKNKINRYCFSICGTWNICEGIKNFFLRFDVNLNLYQHKSGIFYVKSSSHKNIQKIQSILYSQSRIHLGRKKIIFEDLARI